MQFSSCDVCVPAAVPRVQVIASKRVVKVGEPFDVKVIGSASAGLKAIWWFGQGTGIAELDRAHWHAVPGAPKYAEHVWSGVTIGKAGTYTLGANSRDVKYGVELGVAHQASEGAGLATCVVEVRADTSYDAQVELVRAKHMKTAAWASWMKSPQIRERYAPVWEASRTAPTTFKMAFRYGAEPVPYDPPWSSETEHMKALAQLADLAFPGLRFDFLFGVPPESGDVNVTVRGFGDISNALGTEVYLYYETIFAHEFGHILLVQHHYVNDNPSFPVFLPPGEEKCVMIRNSNRYCSGCSAAMHLDPAVDNGAKSAQVSAGILDRYPDA